jgi:hypothetical protein
MSDKENIQGYRFAGDIDVKNVSLVFSDGSLIDLGSITLEINIFQDLFKHYLECEVVISDALTIFSDSPFTGGEILVVSYKTRDKSMEHRTHLFGIHTITDRQKIDEKIEAYVLNGISAEAYNTGVSKISRTYGQGKGNTISNMIKSIIDEYVYNSKTKGLYNNYNSTLGVGVKKNIDVDSTNGVQKLVVPNMTVDATIDFMASESDCDGHAPYYVFYESTDGFNFKDVNTLVAADAYQTYHWIPTNTKDLKREEDTVVKDFQKIQSFNIIRQSDILLNARNGLFRSKIINLDILRKNKKEVVFNYDNEYKKFNKLQPNKILGSSNDDSYIFMMQSRTGHDSSIFADENVLPKRINTFISRKKAFQRHIFNNVVEVSIPGDSDLTVGKVIDLNIPYSTTLEKLDGKQDKYLSGRYLVTKVRHKFGGKTGSEYQTIIQCTKDTGME